MAYNQNRFSSYSNLSATTSNAPTPQQSTQVSTQTLLNSLHLAYNSSKPYCLDVATSLVVNTWLTAATEGPEGRQGGTVDVALATKVYEHARRRWENGCVVLGSSHESTPTLFAPFVAALPLPIPPVFYTALAAIQPFVTHVTPHNPAAACYSSLAVTFETNTTSGELVQARLALSRSGIDTAAGLLNIPSEHGYRGFDAFYYLLSTIATTAEKDVLSLKAPHQYSLLKKSATYDPPPYLPTADDAASAEEFRAALKAVGISGKVRRDLLSTLAAILKLGDTLSLYIDEEELVNTCEDAATLLAVDPDVLIRRCSTSERETLVAGLYECLVYWVVTRANDAIATELAAMRHDSGSDSDSRPGAMTPVTSTAAGEDTASITIVDIPNQQLGKAICLRTIFDDSDGINAEMKQDGIAVAPAGHSVLAEMNNAVALCEAELGIKGGHGAREKELARDAIDRVLDKLRYETEDENCFLRTLLLQPDESGVEDEVEYDQHGRFDLATKIGSNRVWFHLAVHPTDELPANLAATKGAWSAGSPSRQLRSWRLAEWANRRNRKLDFTVDYDLDEFQRRYAPIGCQPGRDGIDNFLLERGWSNGEIVVGHERIWLREGAWMEAEGLRDTLNAEAAARASYVLPEHDANNALYNSPFGDAATIGDSRDNLLQRNQSSASLGARSALGGRSLAPTHAQTVRSVSGGDYGLGSKGDEQKGALSYYNDLDPEFGDSKIVAQQPISKSRRIWVAIVWALTFWIPSPALRLVGRMKRPDVRMAWREKLVLVFIIFMINAIIVFYIIEFGRLICPNFDKAWNPQEVSYHQGKNDFYVSVRGRVYDITKFWQIDHSSIVQQQVTKANMLPLAGQGLDQIFPIPLATGCAGLVNSNERLTLEYNNTNAAVTGSFVHTSGYGNHYAGALTNPNWYNVTFMPRMKEYYKGDLVFTRKNITDQGTSDERQWFVINNRVFDLTDYFHTQSVMLGDDRYSYLAPEVEDIAQQNPGSDVTGLWNDFVAKNASGAALNYFCLNNVYYIGQTDFRATARCQVNNYILLAFTIILCSVILIKFLAALQLGSKRRPAQQDKFVICQVPCYTEGEDHLRKGLDSLTALAYDNKRKLICVICDGMIVGGGNDRPTPKIVLDILGVDPKIDPPALPFKSVGAGSEQLNYGKVYSGLYEYEGNVVPYIVVVKVGKESEQTKAKPGNRGKRDSQILLMSFLNRVHHRSRMSPLELEIFHQINNIIGVDPELYEYLFMVDADTMVKEDALNRLVASCANDAKIAGICGETSLENEEHSWWTMIQVYEYYISHHLAKAFESLFGSVTCLPGCFCMYRLRTADKGKPLIISDKVINEYADCEVDTLHKKNLLSLGEDRYLTTLMTKHFPHMSYKFVPDAYALTAAPETWSILLSQRRRWINSTIHNLAELFFLRDLCGFCCFSMRFVVFVDLFGTIILPATCAYFGYLIYRVAAHQGQFPLISIIIIAAVYGLQAIIFLIKRQWQHIGWMIIYIIAFPIYSFVLPIYSFWKQDDFSWGNTRIVIGEKGSKQIVALDDEGFDPRSIPLQCWDDYAVANNLPGRRGMATGSEKGYNGGYDDGYEMDDMRSVYSSVKPASTILTGFKSYGNVPYMAPQSPAPFAQRPNPAQRHSSYSNLSHYTDHPGVSRSPMPMQQMSQQNLLAQPQSPFFGGQSAGFASQENLLSNRATPPPGSILNRAGTTSPMPYLGGSRPGSQAHLPLPNFQGSNISGHDEPRDAVIAEAVQACLQVVDLDSVTKKQLRALTEQRLQVQLGAERRAFLDRQIDLELANM